MKKTLEQVAAELYRQEIVPNDKTGTIFSPRLVSLMAIALHEGSFTMREIREMIEDRVSGRHASLSRQLLDAIDMRMLLTKRKL